ncbi:MAG: PilT/PilU family type 4a pilus ATPase [Gallionellaceae bacterium]|nr:PilT/PilU family type 4a pilus ATPase [Gallionellaceae bacterium]
MQLTEFVVDALLQPGVSDVHLTTNNPPWVRRDGKLLPSQDMRVADGDLRMLLDRFKITDPMAALADVGARESRMSQEDSRTGLDFGADLHGTRLRCNLSLANGGLLSLVIRRLNDHIPPLESLGFPSSIIRYLDHATGLILVTGQTGSGKSTTLAAMLDHINQHLEGHIITIEDPIEYILPAGRCKVTRKEIGLDSPSFHAALRAAMRQDPDVIMIGEIRDRETLTAALAAADTGHLVLGTLHTKSAVKAVDRILSLAGSDNQDLARSSFASVMNCIVAQTLVPRKEGGRLLAYEILAGTPSIASNIALGQVSQIPNIMATGRADGHVLMNANLADLVRRGTIERDSALSAAYDRNGLEQELKR